MKASSDFWIAVVIGSIGIGVVCSTLSVPTPAQIGMALILVSVLGLIDKTRRIE